MAHASDRYFERIHTFKDGKSLISLKKKKTNNNLYLLFRNTRRCTVKPKMKSVERRQNHADKMIIGYVTALLQ